MIELSKEEIIEAKTLAIAFITDAQNMFRPWLDSESFIEGYAAGLEAERKRRTSAKIKVVDGE